MSCAEIEGAMATWTSHRVYREPAHACDALGALEAFRNLPIDPLTGSCLVGEIHQRDPGATIARHAGKGVQ